MVVPKFYPARVSRTTPGSPQNNAQGTSQQISLKYPDVASAIVDHLVQHSFSVYSLLHNALSSEQRPRLGHTLTNLVREGIVRRLRDGRYQLSKASCEALAA